jgi:hypothetical protein
MKRAASGLALLAALAACTTAEERHYADYVRPSAEDPALRKLTAERLEKFSSEQELAEYIDRIRAIAKERGAWWAGEGVQYASLQPPEPEPPCDPEVDDCGSDRVVLTGSAISAPASVSTPIVAYSGESSAGAETITNVQKAGVDEGDIVKRIGEHLVVLQDGRLFAVDMRTLSLTDREDVYTPKTDDAWYDEILVTGRRVLVTGFNYGEQATQFSVFALDEVGRFTAEGTFFLSSQDYYDTDNYATRLVGDKLVIYSPTYLTDYHARDVQRWPVVRRWSETLASEDQSALERPLFDARDIYKPLQPTLAPTIHTISVCDLSAEAMKANLQCKTTAFVGPEERTFYVSPDDVYVWLGTSDDLWQDQCKAANVLDFDDGLPATVYKVPLSGAKPKVMHVRGMPRDQFAMDTSSGDFRALVFWGHSGCDRDDYDRNSTLNVKYFSAPMSMFRDDIRTASAWRYTTAPEPDGMDYENRFTDGYAVYGGRESWRTRAPDADEPAMSASLVAVPVGDPRNATVLSAPHSINRLERVGDDIVAAGYRDAAGLSVSMLDLTSQPRVADTLVLTDRYESEGRSHAFNARLNADGDGLMGIPTVKRPEDSNRYWWWSEVSDVSFMAFNRGGQIEDAGALTGAPDSEHPYYKCQVSCVDWYGNARPIFIRDRIFALTGTEIVEGRLAEGKVIEVRRVNLTAPTE